MEQELLILPEQLSSPQFLVGFMLLIFNFLCNVLTDKGQKKKDERNKGIVRSHINQTRTDKGQKKKDERNKGIVRSHINQTRTDKGPWSRNC
jgi:hypothetical protein